MLPLRLLPPLLAAACTASAVDVAPPKYEPYFPTGMALSADERWLFVLSANSDLRYSSGSVQVIDLDRVDELAAGWVASRNARGDLECAPLPGRPLVLGCPLTLSGGEPSPAIVAGGSVLVGNFGVSLDAQSLLDTGGAPSSIVRVFATVRGDPSVTWMDFDTANGTMSCGGSGDFPRCAETHRLARLRNDATLPGLPEEPFTLHVNGDHVYVTHFTTGFLSLFSAPRTVGSQPMLQDTARNLWAQNNVSGATGSAGVAARPGDPAGLVYVTSRQESRVSMVTVSSAAPDEDGLPRDAVVRAGWFFLSGVDRAGFQGDSRDLRFSPDGSRAWVMSRLPPSLQLFDTSLDERGAPRNQHLDTVEVCEQPANLAVAELADGAVVAVPCFTNGQVWFFEGTTLDLVAVEQSGRGPSGVVASRTRNKVYVGNYAEDTISVIDVAPGSDYRHRTVVRLGTPRPIEEQL